MQTEKDLSDKNRSVRTSGDIISTVVKEIRSIADKNIERSNRSTSEKTRIREMEHSELIEKLTKAVLSRLNTSVAKTTEVNKTENGTGENKAHVNTVPENLNRLVDYTQLKPDASKDRITVLCDDAVKNDFYSVCVNPYWVEFCAKKLGSTDVKVVSVVGFPLGALSIRAKAFETRSAVGDGADEIDMVMNIGALKSRDTSAVREDIKAVLRSVRQKTVVKAVIETALLTEEETELACKTANEAGIRFIVPSTGFFQSASTAAPVTTPNTDAGESPEIVAAVRRAVGTEGGIKAGLTATTFQEIEALLRNGATRIGICSESPLAGALKK